MQRCNKLIIIISIIIFSVVIGIQYKTINAYEIENKNSKTIRDEFNLVEENNKVIDILTFNDFHGKVLESEKNIGASKLTSIIKEYKIKEEENGKYGVITVAGGNLYEGTGISKKLNEEVVNKMMDEIGVVASVIGNHEYDLGRNNLRNLSNQVNFKFVASNLIDEETGSVPEYAVPYVIEEVENINVAFIGIVTEGILKNEKLGNIKGLKVLDALDSLNKYSEEVRDKGADIIIALTNLPSEKDEDNIIIGEAAENEKKAHDIDAVITTRELIRMIRSAHISPQTLVDVESDRPMHEGTGAGVIFGATGGVMEAALRSAYYIIKGENPPAEAFTAVRSQGFNENDGVQEANFQINDITVRTAVVSGLGNTRELIRKIESGEVHYDFVEVMACPGGCVGGGGQPIHDGEERAFERGKNLYYLDRNANLRFSHENPDVIQMYKEYFEAPMSHKAHMLLHTEHKKNM